MLKVDEGERRLAGKSLRTGYTTGACAAAAARAAALALVTGKPVGNVRITLPGGNSAEFSVSDCRLQDASATCSVIKDAGDDPDVTHGAEIRATVCWATEPGVQIEGGEGVGRVTRPGLGLEVGSAAINPVPQRMITESLLDVMGQAGIVGARVVISVPRGRELARRTLNPRLGIAGGISILGTTGIVVPYSTSAFRACILQAIDVAVANGASHLVLATGGRSEAFAQRVLPLPEFAFIQMGDWVGLSLKACARKGVAKVTLCGMIGKLSKIAFGHFQTHVSRSAADLASLAALASRLGAPAELAARLEGANTVRHIYEIVSETANIHLPDEICRLACQRSSDLVRGAFSMECLMADFEGKLLLGRASLDAPSKAS